MSSAEKKVFTWMEWLLLVNPRTLFNFYIEFEVKNKKKKKKKRGTPVVEH